MSFKVIVFDFDGTLVDSNQIKYDAYFNIFPGTVQHRETITDILAQMYEESRYVILEKIVRRVSESTLREPEVKEEVASLVVRYNEIVLEGSKTCPERPGAGSLLRELHGKYPLYLSSTTPEDSLHEVVGYRGWTKYFKDIFGYPKKKSSTLRDIMESETVHAADILVVGDGESDRISAEETGCHFFQVTTEGALANVPLVLEDPEKLKTGCLS